MDYKELIDELRFLSSHVPEQMCDNNGENALDRAATAIETLLAERQAAWISAGDRLPEFYDWVLVAVESVAGPLGVMTAYRNRLVSGDWYWWWFGYPSSIGNVTHWMPLPTPPDRQQTDR
ncbi:MAG: protein of unknown function DUF551 [Caudoviricetes sp.]|nr:MAG: protein of unknown function DUF551 [Caudoviricetes sp.]